MMWACLHGLECILRLVGLFRLGVIRGSARFACGSRRGTAFPPSWSDLVSPVTPDAGFALAWIAVRCESWSRAVRTFRHSSVCSLQAGSAGARMPTRGRKE